MEVEGVVILLVHRMGVGGLMRAVGEVPPGVVEQKMAGEAPKMVEAGELGVLKVSGKKEEEQVVSFLLEEAVLS